MRFATRIGAPSERRANARADQIRVARIEAARRNTKWTEIDGPLIRRGPWWVDVESDRLFTLYRGPVFETGCASIAFADAAPLVFTVDGDTLTLFEPVTSPPSWSEVVERRARRLVS